MRFRVICRIDCIRPLVLLAAGSMVIALPTAFGQASASPPPQSTVPVAQMAADAHPSFEVATIKPTDPNDSNQGFHTRGHRISIENETVESLISFAYAIHAHQIVDGPAWFHSDRYDIDGVPDVEGEPNLKQYQEMVQKLLADRFQLKFHREKRELSIYAITIAKGGPKLTKSTADNDQIDQTGNGNGNQHRTKFTNNSMADFALGMQYFMERPVIDQTGLTGRFDFVLTWTPDASHTGDPNAAPGIFTAVQEELGLKLEPTKGPADVLVVDHVERPSEN